MFGGFVPIDPYAIKEYVLDGNQTTSGKTAASLPAGPRVGVFLVAGQSLAGNHGGSAYTPSNASSCLNLNIYNGSLYRLADPVLGCSGAAGSFLGRLADKLIAANRYDQVVMIPVAIGGTQVEHWSTAGYLNHRLRVAINRARGLGRPITAVLWEQGTSDAEINLSTALYKSRFAGVRDTIRGMQCAAPLLVARETYIDGVTNSNVRTAQAELVDHALGIYAGPDTDTITDRDGTHIHLTDSGNDALADLWVTAIAAALG